CMSDIEGSTALWDAQPEAMARALVRHDEIVADVVDAHGGRVLKSMGEGDSTVSVFTSAPQAAAAAIAVTAALDAEPWADGVQIRVRFGLHTGEAERRVADYYGAALNLAARIRGEADGGEVLCSTTTGEVINGRLPDGYQLVDLGVHRLRGIRS